VEAIESTLAVLAGGYKLTSAWAAYDCARIRLQRGAAGDRDRALALIGEALNLSQELGMKPLLEKVLRLKLESQGLSSISVRTSIDAVRESVQAERPELPPASVAPDGTVTILFTDIEGSTGPTERLGDDAWLALLQRHNDLVREQIRAHGGFEVKTIGDGFMVAFQSVRRALECAIEIQKAISSLGAPVLRQAQDGQADASSVHPEPGSPEQSPRVEGRDGFGNEIRVRIGLHAGEAVRDGDDFYGRNVNLASRIGGQALGGQILVSSTLRELVQGAGFRFDQGREVALKGLAGKQLIYEVAWGT